MLYVKTFVFLLCLTFFESTRSEYTVQVDGGQRACYSEHLKLPKGDKHETVEYQASRRIGHGDTLSFRGTAIL